jgi:hypothetical protein
MFGLDAKHGRSNNTSDNFQERESTLYLTCMFCSRTQNDSQQQNAKRCEKQEQTVQHAMSKAGC